MAEGAISVVASGGALAAEVRGIGRRRLDGTALAVIHRAWLDHLVLLLGAPLASRRPRLIGHRRELFDPATCRIMHRTQIKGETRPAA